MEENTVVAAEDTEIADCDGQKVVTMMDVLKEQEDFETNANAVLGASDEKNCTYSKGYIKRQAVYACMTCCSGAKDDPSKRAGVCLACSLTCHENHELIELYTKRNFRCDCGNPKFNSNPCQYTINKSDLNDKNEYNQNFSGLYCVCQRPYPDPESTIEDEMIQCIICEDWLHANHLEATVPSNDQYSEMICKGCMEKNSFLHDYSSLAVNAENIVEDSIDVVTSENINFNGDHNDDKLEETPPHVSEVLDKCVEKNKVSNIILVNECKISQEKISENTPVIDTNMDKPEKYLDTTKHDDTHMDEDKLLDEVSNTNSHVTNNASYSEVNKDEIADESSTAELSNSNENEAEEVDQTANKIIEGTGLLDSDLSTDIKNEDEDKKMLESNVLKVTTENNTSVDTNEVAKKSEDYKRKLPIEESTVDSTIAEKRIKTDSCCIRPKNVKKIYKGATFWPCDFRQKLCTCNDCLTMYEEMSVLFLTEYDDTVTAYESLGEEKERIEGKPTSQYEKGLQALSSLGRVQQINALTEYNKMKDKLLDFLQTFKERKEVVKEEDIKQFFAGMKPKREPDGVYFCR